MLAGVHILIVARAIVTIVTACGGVIAYVLLRRDVDIHEIARGPTESKHG
jgi:hypothetical protein